jgi:hypothetical protein
VKILDSSMFVILVLFFYAHLICVYFQLKKIYHHSIILNFVIQFHSTVQGHQLVHPIALCTFLKVEQSMHALERRNQNGKEIVRAHCVRWKEK